jgi:hypothetical protein
MTYQIWPTHLIDDHEVNQHYIEGMISLRNFSSFLIYGKNYPNLVMDDDWSNLAKLDSG